MDNEENPFLGHIRRAIADGHDARKQNEQEVDRHSGSRIDTLIGEMQQRYEAVIAQIPECVHCHISTGHCYGPVMRLRYDESREDPRWETGYWDNRNPDPTQLQYAALQVFDFCQAHDLKPYVVRGYDFDVQKFFLYLSVDCRHLPQHRE